MSETFANLAGTWWAWTAPMAVQVALLTAVVAVIDRLLVRWATPELRVALWLVVVAKLVLPPTLSSPVSLAQLGPTATDAVASPTSWAKSWIHGGFALWLVGTVFLSALTLARYALLRRQWLGSNREPMPLEVAAQVRAAADRLELRRVPDVRIQQGARGPAVFGFIRPTVVLPPSLVRRATPTQLEHVLLHELAHIKRRDPLMSLVCMVVQLAYWFHPAVWIARSRMTTLREVGCDHMVARALGDTDEYRHTLLHLARPLLRQPSLAPHGFIHRHSQLMVRLTSLGRPLSRRLRLQRACTAALCGILLACCVPLARPLAPAAAMPSTADLPGASELEGCMQLRFLVYRALAEQEERERTR